MENCTKKRLLSAFRYRALPAVVHYTKQRKCFSLPLQNTYTNADKLLEAAEQLAQTGECDPEEIYKAARHLEVRIQDFVRRVEHRKLLLDMSVSFHTHTKEVGTLLLFIPCSYRDRR